ncbi:hypothetical protein ACFQ8E_15100 [Isoptericola sp. NPDC056573]|uniref:hypothetical protein n=1 Tax=Isoptericola sp. NPDC056573 TaxID=3345868 RepID=UPI00368D9155
MSVAPRTKFMIACACLFAVCGLLLALWGESTLGRVLGGIQVLIGIGLAVAQFRDDRRRRSTTGPTNEV